MKTKTMYPELKKFKELDQLQDLELINLGTGMGYYDFRYESTGVNAFNFALPQQNLYFDYQLLKHYSFKMKKQCVVCIVLPYFIFCADQYEVAKKRWERYYFLLPKETVKLYCNSSYDEWKQKDIKITDEEDSLRRVLSPDEMERQVEDAIINWVQTLKLYSLDSGYVMEPVRKEMKHSKKWLNNIVVHCKKMQFIPVVIVPPMCQLLMSKISGEFRKRHFYDLLEEVIPKDVLILDYSQNAYFCRPNRYGWPGFLAEEAAGEFTRDVVERLPGQWNIG